MIKGILAKKIGMTRIFSEDAKAVPVTVLKAGPCYVVGVRTDEKDGYKAVILGFDEKPLKKMTKPMQGIMKAEVGKGFKVMKEFETDEPVEPGTKVDVSIFEEGEVVDITGTSKGKGFQGVIKRWGFSGGPRSHGSRFHRAPGSIGQHTEPAKIWKGKKMPGHMGAGTVTVKNLKVVDVDKDGNLLLVKGAVPGAPGSIVLVRKK